MKTFYLFVLCFFLKMPTVFSACFTADVKFILNGEAQFSKEEFCEYKTPEKILFYVSKGCEGQESGRCKLLKRPLKTLVIKDYKGNIGSPGFKLCRALDGVPQIFEWKSGDKKWQSTERCLLGNEFVEIGLLTKIWKKKIK